MLCPRTRPHACWPTLCPAGLLFVGSRVGPSNFVEVGWQGVWEGGLPAAAPGTSQAPEEEWEVLPPELGGIGSLAPIHSGAVVADPSGCGDARLLLGCGSGPTGRLALARWAAGLEPVVSGAGPPLVGGVARQGMLWNGCIMHKRSRLAAVHAG